MSSFTASHLIDKEGKYNIFSTCHDWNVNGIPMPDCTLHHTLRNSVIGFNSNLSLQYDRTNGEHQIIILDYISIFSSYMNPNHYITKKFDNGYAYVIAQNLKFQKSGKSHYYVRFGEIYVCNKTFISLVKHVECSGSMDIDFAEHSKCISVE